MTIREAEERFAEIESAGKRGDDGRAHRLEDALFRAVIDHVVEESPDAKDMAEIAQRCRALGFSRWYE